MTIRHIILGLILLGCSAGLAQANNQLDLFYLNHPHIELNSYHFTYQWNQISAQPISFTSENQYMMLPANPIGTLTWQYPGNTIRCQNPANPNNPSHQWNINITGNLAANTLSCKITAKP